MNAKALCFFALTTLTLFFGGYLLGTSLWFHVFPTITAILVLVILILLCKISFDYHG